MQIPFLNRLQMLVAPSSTASAGKAVQIQAEATVAALREELPELLAAAVIDMERGQALASFSSTRDLVPAKAAPYNAEVIRQKRRALEVLQLSDEKIDDILITMRNQLHLLRPSENGQKLLYLVVSSHDTNLAIARAVLRSHSL